MSTISFKDRREIDKQKKQALKMKRAERTIARTLNDMTNTNTNAQAEMNAYLKSAVSEVRSTLQQASDLMSDTIARVEHGFATTPATNTEVINLLTIFRRDVGTLEEKRKRLVDRLTEEENNAEQETSSARITTLIFDEVLEFAVEVAQILIPQATQIQELVKKPNVK